MAKLVILLLLVWFCCQSWRGTVMSQVPDIENSNETATSQMQDQQITAFVMCDDKSQIYVDDVLAGNTSSYKEHWKGFISLEVQRIGILCKNTGGPGGIMASLSNGLVTNARDWKCNGNVTENWNIKNATATATPFQLQQNSPVSGNSSHWRWRYAKDFSTEAYFIWPYERPETQGGGQKQTVYCEALLDKLWSKQIIVQTTVAETAPTQTGHCSVQVCCNSSCRRDIQDIDLDQWTKQYGGGANYGSDAKGAQGIGATFIMLCIAQLIFFLILDSMNYRSNIKYARRMLARRRKWIKTCLCQEKTSANGQRSGEKP